MMVSLAVNLLLVRLSRQKVEMLGRAESAQKAAKVEAARLGPALLLPAIGGPLVVGIHRVEAGFLLFLL
jgi:hypothetical protein